MNDAVQTQILEWLVGGLVLVLLTLVWFGVRRWMDHVDGLQESMDKLRDTILSLSKEFVTQTQYRSDTENLRLRRASDTCPSTDCPFEKTDGGQRIEVTGSGAKSLQTLLDAAKAHRGAQ